MFIQTENTPNPNAVKFLPGILISPDSPQYFTDVEEARKVSLLAYNLLETRYVKSVFFGEDFITVAKEENIEWAILKPEILMIMMDHFLSNLPIFQVQKPRNDEGSQANLSEVEKQIIEIIETRVRPSVAMDGGDIIYKGFENGVVKLQLHGSCAGCPSSTITLKNGIESMLKHFVPEVEEVIAVD